MKSRNLNFLKPYGPLQAWKGTALSYINTQVLLGAGKNKSQIIWQQKGNNLHDYYTLFLSQFLVKYSIDMIVLTYSQNNNSTKYDQ